MPTPGGYVLNFGKHRGQNRSKIAEEDDGLRYLDWFVGESKDKNLVALLRAFLKEPALQRRLDTMLEDR